MENPHDALSDREFQVLRMRAAGKTVKDIGAELLLSVETISRVLLQMIKCIAFAQN